MIGKGTRMKPLLAIQRSNERSYRGDETTPILFWDIDKTYLNTHFSTWRGLAGIPFEFAVDKEPVAGAVALLHALRHGPEQHSRLTPLYFVSASPPQLAKVLRRRMVLDGVDFDGLSFKDQLALIRRGRLRCVVNHTAYKLGALIQYAAELPASAPLYFFGDDAEDDAGIVTLFAEICLGERRGERLCAALRRRGVSAEPARVVCELADTLPARKGIQGIYIHRISGRELGDLGPQSALVVNFAQFFELALQLLGQGLISQRGAARVWHAMQRRGSQVLVLQDCLNKAKKDRQIDAAQAEQLAQDLDPPSPSAEDANDRFR